MGTLAAGGRQLAAKDPATAFSELRITIYDQAHLPREVMLTAVDRLRLIFHESGIAIDVVIGDPAADEASLFLYVARPSKDKERQAACNARRDIALKIASSSPAGLQETVLGMSSPFAPAGLNVRVFDDHILEAAACHGQSHAIVLSYAMAHEIGHVLLRCTGHADWGIMSSVWTQREYAQMSGPGSLSFIADQAKRMSRNLRGMGCPSSNPTVISP